MNYKEIIQISLSRQTYAISPCHQLEYDTITYINEAKGRQ